MTGSAGEALGRPRILLTGDASARPHGLERALTRAGFHISETPPQPSDPPADALLTTLHTADTDRLRHLLADAAAEPPRVFLFEAEDREAPGLALAFGAADALATPVHLPELCARLTARIRDRQAPARTPYERRIRDTLRDLVGEARTLLQPDEVAQALVRRLGRALGLAHCSFVLTRAGEDEGRVIADFSEGPTEHTRLDLARHPEVVEAARTRRVVATRDVPGASLGMSSSTMMVLPVVVDQEVAGVLLMREHEASPPLNATQLDLAGGLAEAAARALGSGSAGRAHPLTSPTLDRRLQEELERARRYSLSFSLVLLDLDRASEADVGTAERQVHEVGSRLRRELRLPDFVSGYGDTGFALVLPETGADGARRSVLRLRERLTGVSAGIAAYPHPAVTAPDDMFALVEAALRRGQAQTGERIGVAE